MNTPRFYPWIFSAVVVLLIAVLLAVLVVLLIVILLVVLVVLLIVLVVLIGHEKLPPFKRMQFQYVPCDRLYT